MNSMQVAYLYNIAFMHLYRPLKINFDLNNWGVSVWPSAGGLSASQRKKFSCLSLVGVDGCLSYCKFTHLKQFYDTFSTLTPYAETILQAGQCRTVGTGNIFHLSATDAARVTASLIMLLPPISTVPAPH